MTRVLAVWCMDWPAMAAAASAGLPPTAQIAVTCANRVVACSSAARAAGFDVVPADEATDEAMALAATQAIGRAHGS